MGKINVLDDSLIDKIAAGEVIERPASVVKELIENAIDAGATQIFIEVKEGGKRLIKVTDNGSGMDSKDAQLCFQRHATSKIKELSDLFNIRSLGFRGEALASIAAVSLLRIITKQESDLSGTLVEIEGSKLIKRAKIGANKGTSVEVNNLFYNTPARKKYLKITPVEFAVITDIVTRYALRYPTIFFKLIHEDRLSLSSPGTESMLNNIASIYGKDIAKSLIKIKHEDDYVKIYGYVSKPNLTRADKKQQSVFINGRYIKCRPVTEGLHDAYHTMIMTNRYPIAVLMLELDPKHLDVNVHPAKDMIRIDKENRLRDTIFEAVKNSLLKEDLVPKVEVSSKKLLKSTARYSFSKDKQVTLAVKEPKKIYSHVRVEAVEKPKSIFGGYQIVQQLNKMYILLQNQEGLAIVDQHAAEERINYEKFMKQYENKELAVQRLVYPKLLNLTPTERTVLVHNLDMFERLGFKVEEFGPESFVLKTIPAVFESADGVVVDMIKELTEIDKKMLLNKKEERIIKRACKASIKAGSEMTEPEMKKLINELEKCEDPYHCAHGRPTVIKITLSELERKFRRVV